MISSSLKAKWDNKKVLDYAEEKAKYDQLLDIVKELKLQNLSIEEIAEITKLSAKEIEKL